MDAPTVDRAVRHRLEELCQQLSGNTMAIRTWQEVMTKNDRRELLRLVDQESRQQKLDDDNPECDGSPSNEELLQGLPGKLLHRCYHRWGVVGMWAKARNCTQSKAIVDLALEHDLISLALHRRLMQAVGGLVQVGDSIRPEWNLDVGKLFYAGELVRTAAGHLVGQPVLVGREHVDAQHDAPGAAALGHRLGEVGEQHGEPQPQRDREHEARAFGASGVVVLPFNGIALGSIRCRSGDRACARSFAALATAPVSGRC